MTSETASEQRAEPTADQGGRVGWLELFFDLVFVTALGIVNEAVRDSDLGTHALGILLATAGIFIIWVLVTLIHSRFPRETPMRRLLMVVVMIGLTVGAMGLDETIGVGAQLGQMGFAAALAAIGAMILNAAQPSMRWSPVVLRGVTTLWAAAVISLVAALLPIGDVAEYVVMGLVAISALVVLDVNFTRHLDEMHPVRPAHLMERLGLLSLIVLGEGFTVLVVALRGEGAVLDPRFFLLTFVLVFLLWQMFFDGVLSEHRPFRRWKTAILGQYFLIVGIVGMLDMMADLSASVHGDSGLGSLHYAMYASIAFLGFAILAIAREADRRELVGHVALAALNFALVGVAVTSVGGGLQVSALIGAVLLAVDSLAVIQLSKRRAAAQS